MSKWEFVVKELKVLQQEKTDEQWIAELFVEQILLRGYNIVRTNDQQRLV